MTTSTTVTIASFTGDTIQAVITLEEIAAGIKVSVSVADGFIGDLRGVFFHIGDESLISTLSITGSQVTTSVFGNGNDIRTTNGDNLINIQNPAVGGGFDFAVELGTSGIGKDDIRSAEFIISSSSKQLTLLDFVNANPNGPDVGVRITSVGENREGSSQLVGEITLPDPILGPGIANTPGFWRQEHHYGYWPAGYEPTQGFRDTFNLDASVGLTFGDSLLGGLTARGGGVSALGRSGTAGLLNAASDAQDSGINYVIDVEALAESASIIGASLSSVLETLRQIDGSYGGTRPGRIEVSEVIGAVSDALTPGGLFNPATDIGRVAIAFDAMNNMPSLEKEDFRL